MTKFVERKPLSCTIYESHCSMYKTRGPRRRELHMIVKLLHGSNPVYKTVKQKLILFLSCHPRIPVQKCLPPCSCRTASLYVYLHWWIACLQLHSQGQKLKPYLDVINQQVVKVVQDRDSWKKVIEQARTVCRLQRFIRRRISKWLVLTTFKRCLYIG